MSTGQTGPNPVPSSQIIQQRIDQMRAQNDVANTQLNEQLQQMRENLNLPGTPAGGSPTAPPPVASDDILTQRVLLASSTWGSEVIFAAALDEEFKEQTAQRAREILVDRGILPPNVDPGSTTG